MANRNLTAEELSEANELLNEIRSRLQELAGDDSELLFAYRRKIYKELTYDERGKPGARRKLKEQKRVEQGNLCPICEEPLPLKYAVLDRHSAAKGYTLKIHALYTNTAILRCRNREGMPNKGLKPTGTPLRSAPAA